MVYKSRIGKLLAKRIWFGRNGELLFIVYNERFHMDKVTKEEYASLDLPLLELKSEVDK